MWDQRSYVAYRVGGYIWLAIETSPNMLLIWANVKTGSFSQADLAKRLGVKEFDQDESLSEKLALPSSVRLDRKQSTDTIILRIKPEFDLGSQVFLAFLKDVYKAFSKADIGDNS